MVGPLLSREKDVISGLRQKVIAQSRGLAKRARRSRLGDNGPVDSVAGVR